MAKMPWITAVNLSSGTAIVTVIQIVTGTNTPVKITEIGCSFAGTSNTAAPIDVQVLRQTTAGTASAGTVNKLDSDRAGTLQTTSQITFTAEPTAGAVLQRWFIHPQSGMVWVARDGNEIIVPAASRLGIRYATAPGAAVQNNVYVVGEE